MVTTTSLADVLNAYRPEDLFGPAVSEADLKRVRRELALQFHPDAYAGTADEANRAMANINRLYDVAVDYLARGIYGKATILTTKKGAAYTVGRRVAQGDIATVFEASALGYEKLLLKMARHPVDNDLLSNEATTLRNLRAASDSTKFQPFFAEIVDAFRHKEASLQRSANVFVRPEGFYTLRQVRQGYPSGVVVRDMAWIYRRLLFCLGYVHQQGVVHGAITPDHVLIHPEKHGLILVDWCYATRGSALRAVPPDYKSWYPEEALKKEQATSALDIWMATRCMIYVLGQEATRPLTIGPSAIRAFFRGTLLANPRRRPTQAWSLLEEFDNLLERMWGARRFHPFRMPKHVVPV